MNDLNDNTADGAAEPGGTYAQGDFRAAAQRSTAHVTANTDAPRIDSAVNASSTSFAAGGHEVPAVERVARVLAARRLSINGVGTSSSAGTRVDQIWSSFIEDAVGILNALRQPDAAMLAAGDGPTWTAMVRAALGEPVEPVSRTRVNAPGEIYQKPLG
jgi:hypothetical protein